MMCRAGPTAWKPRSALSDWFFLAFVTGIHKDSVRRWNLWFPLAGVFTEVLAGRATGTQITFPPQQQSTASQSGHAVLAQVRSMCSWTLHVPCVSSLLPCVLHLSHGFQCSPTLNCQPYEGRLPLTCWWRKLSNMTVGQSSLISLAHHCYDWHPGRRCG